MPEGKKILIADDSAFMRKVVIEALKSAGYSTFFEADNGNKAIAMFEQENPDLILLDVIMPEKDGLEVVREIGQKVNIIMVSAVGQESVVNEAMSYGAKGFVIKPFDNDKIIAEVGKFLK